MRSTAFTSITAAAVTAVMTASCADAPSGVSHEMMHAPAMAKAPSADASSAALAKAVHAATSRYHSIVQATKAGYVSTVDCVAVPGLGGMGVHWVNESLVDPVFDPTQPEALLYEPDKHGKMKLVAVEYLVIKPGPNAPAPTFGGQAFDDGGSPIPVPHWSLHVWLHKDNPGGMFRPFNPAVSCNN